MFKILLMIFLILLMINVFISILLDYKRKNKIVSLCVIADNPISYESFYQITMDLETVRKHAIDNNLSEEDKNKLLIDIDNKLMELQNYLFDSQSGGIPDPSVLTKGYLQSFTIKTLELRIMYEALMGRNIVKKSNQEESNILRIIPKEENK